jgi:hypothetical protein
MTPGMMSKGTQMILYFALRNVASGMTSIFFAIEYVFSPGYTT